MIETPDTSILEGNNERRGFSTTSTEESRVVIGHEETNDGERGNVNNGLWFVCEKRFAENLPLELTIRQKVPFTAAGIVSRGLGVSEAAKPTSSVPAEGRVNFEGSRNPSVRLTKGKSSSDKYGANSLEAMGECARVLPHRTTDVGIILAA